MYGTPLNTKQRKDGIRDIIVFLSLFMLAFVLMLNIKPENQTNAKIKTMMTQEKFVELLQQIIKTQHLEGYKEISSDYHLGFIHGMEFLFEKINRENK